MDIYIEKQNLSPSEYWEELYRGKNRFQTMQVFRSDKGYRLLFLNGNLILHEEDCHRYYESLAVIPYIYTQLAKHVLILGGNTGLCANELLRFPVRTISVVDEDKQLADLCKEQFQTFGDSRIEFVNQNPIKYLLECGKKYLLIIMDYPDFTNPNVMDFYTVDFLGRVKECKAPGGVVVLSLPSPFHSPKAFSCMIETVKTVFGPYNILPYWCFMPYLKRQIGFIMAAPSQIQLQLPNRLRYLNGVNLMAHFCFGNDEVWTPIHPATKDNGLFIKLLTTPFARNHREEEIHD